MRRCIPSYRSLVTILSLLSAACGYDNGDRVKTTASNDVKTSYGTIDTGAKMENVESGVGVFVEYATGGNWTMQVGCDTASTDLDCVWDIWAHTESTSIPIISSQSLDLETSDLLTVYSDGELHLQTTTRTDLDGVSFVTEPGQPVTFDVWLDGENYPEEFFYFISEGNVQTGAATPVIQLTPSAE